MFNVSLFINYHFLIMRPIKIVNKTRNTIEEYYFLRTIITLNLITPVEFYDNIM